ncbi:hypothetical protein AB1Y20_018501 [Prymnesium parvum]|uniref:Uncharacterized protein n=1 Tax=Prymnesium parvum TaxID=97485 RepID=A0AB34JQ51_PRYPA
MSAATNDAYEEVVTILRSLKKVKGVRLQINSEFWGIEYAAQAETTTCSGLVDRWADAAKKEALYVKWAGYGRCQLAPLDKMDKDAEGNPLNLTLLPFDDGRPPPEVEENRATAMAGSSGAVADDGNGEDAEREEEAEATELEVNDQKWVMREPKFNRLARPHAC